MGRRGEFKGHNPIIPGKMNYVPANKKKAGDGGYWPIKKRMEVVSTYIATGNHRLTARLCGVPVSVITYWKKQQWWAEAINDLSSESQAKLSTKMAKVRDMALEAVMDRIENGDIYIDKEGKARRAPAKLKDVLHAANSMVDKEVLLRKNTAKAIEKQETMNERLMSLAEQFAEIANKKKEKVINPEDIMDVDDLNAKGDK